MSSTSPEVMKWFTRARRFPQLIGRTPDGARIPGGPYTITQVVGAGVVLLVGTRTMGLWAHYGLLTNAVILLSVTAAVVFGLGKIPVGSRSPLSVSAGALRALSAPPTGRVAGRPVRVRRPHQVRHRLVVLASAAGTPDLPGMAPDAAVADPPAVPVTLARPAPPLPAATRRRRQPRELARASPTGPAHEADSGPAPSRAAAGRRTGSRTAPSATATPAPPRRTAPALSGVQALLAQTTTRPSPAQPTSSRRPGGSSHLKDR